MAKTETIERSQFTARQVSNDVKHLFDKKKLENNPATGKPYTSPELFEEMVITFLNPKPESEQISALNQQINTLTEQLAEAHKTSTNQLIDYSAFTEISEKDVIIKTMQDSGVQDLSHAVKFVLEAYLIKQDQITSYQEIAAKDERRIADLKKQIEASKNDASTGVQLAGSQFICEFQEQVALNARRSWPFLKKDKLILGPDEQFPNELANLAVHTFLNDYYSHVIIK